MKRSMNLIASLEFLQALNGHWVIQTLLLDHEFLLVIGVGTHILDHIPSCAMCGKKMVDV